jgi:hypothetical protein
MTEEVQLQTGRYRYRVIRGTHTERTRGRNGKGSTVRSYAPGDVFETSVPLHERHTDAEERFVRLDVPKQHTPPTDVPTDVDTSPKRLGPPPDAAPDEEDDMDGLDELDMEWKVVKRGNGQYDVVKFVSGNETADVANDEFLKKREADKLAKQLNS